MIRDLIADIVAKSLAALQEAGELPAAELPHVEVERPKQAEHGDYATNVAMKLAATLRASGQPKVNPRALGELIAARIRETVAVVPAYALVESVEVEGPGFINLRLKPDWLLSQAAEVIAAGNAFGGPKLAPVLSPNKTWAGAIGGFLAAVAAALLLGGWVLPRVGLSLDAGRLVLVGAAVGLVAQVGDVAESLFKREVQVKDSSTLIPGHGGVLDRLDSLYFVLPVSAGLFRLFGLV